MSDGLTLSPTREPGPPDDTARPAWVAPAVRGVVVVLVFAAVGLFAGWLWYELWRVPTGVAVGGEWFSDEAGLREDFAGLAWYVTVATLAGLLLGVLAGWLFERDELVVLVAVLLGSVLAGYLMYRVGTHLSPPDPRELARTSPDGTELDGALRVPGWPPRGAFPFGALLGLAVVYAASASRAPADPSRDPARDLSRDPSRDRSGRPVEGPSVESAPEAGTRG